MIKSYIFPFFNRFFHLFFIVCFMLAYLLASTQKGFSWHIIFGLLFGAGIVCRLIWGFVGTKHSRFKDFHFSGVFEYLRSIFGEKKHFIAHNPASSWAVMLIFLLGLLSAFSGLLIWGQSEQKGIFSGLYFSYTPHLNTLHEFFAHALLFVVIVHICGVLIDRFYNKSDGINVMISGYKLTPKDESVRLNFFQKAFFGVSLLAIVCLCVFLPSPANSLLYSNPAPKFSLETQVYELYKKECASCHIGYAPYLLPKKAWGNLMSNLDNHFGDDASLDEEEFEQILAFLEAHSMENYNTQFKAGLDKENVNEIAISKYKFYEKAHQNLPQEIFKNERIKSKAHCQACHKKAELGFFGKSELNFIQINALQKNLKATQ